MNRLLRAEFLKLRSIRLPYGLLGASTVLCVLVALLLASRAGHVVSGRTVPPIDSATGLARVITATRFAMLFSAVLGVVIAAGEFRHATATSTYLAAPRRAHVLVAKAVVAITAGLVFGAVAAGATTGVGLAFTAAKGAGVALSATTILRYIFGAALGAGLLAVAGTALGTLVRHQVGAVVGVLAWGFVAEQIIAAEVPSVGRYLPFTVAFSMAGVSDRLTAPLPFWGGALLMAGIASAIGVIASQTTLSRDIA